MIGLESFSAVFSRPVAPLADLPNTAVFGQTKDVKTSSPSARYAVEAVRLLPRDVAAMDVAAMDMAAMGLVCISGPTGSTVAAFDKAWNLSADGKLTGAGFAQTRSRRIHPFTLMRSLQNQVPAILSMTFGMKGPCLNALDDSAALIHLLPNIQAMLATCPKILLVMAAAGARAEEAAKAEALSFHDDLEGAICLVLSRTSGLGYLETGAASSSFEAAPPWPPALAAGIEILSALAQGRKQHLIIPSGPASPQTCLFWRTL